MQKQVEYEQAVKTKYPEQVVFAVAKDENGKANPMTIGWCTMVSGSPPMMAIALAHKRYTASAIRHSRCFTLVYPSSDMASEALFFGTKSGRDTDKLKATNVRTEPAQEIDSVIFTDAVANFECVLENEFTTGDHVLFVGKVIASHVNTEKKKRLYTLATGGTMGEVKTE